MNDEYSKKIATQLKKQNMSELPPGETPRRYEPTEGVANLNKRIHKESEFTDKHKNMPFTFSKPKQAKKNVVKVCSNCKELVSAHKETVGIICSKCKKYARVEEVYVEEK